MKNLFLDTICSNWCVSKKIVSKPKQWYIFKKVAKDGKIKLFSLSKNGVYVKNERKNEILFSPVWCVSQKVEKNGKKENNEFFKQAQTLYIYA